MDTEFTKIYLSRHLLKAYQPQDVEVNGFLEVSNSMGLAIQIPKFFKVNDTVRITKGEQQGLTGIIKALEDRTGSISVSLQDAYGKELLVDIESKSCELVLEVGDSVSVRLGLHCGRTGIIEALLEHNISIRTAEFEQVCLSPPYLTFKLNYSRS